MCYESQTRWLRHPKEGCRKIHIVLAHALTRLFLVPGLKNPNMITTRIEKKKISSIENKISKLQITLIDWTKKELVCIRREQFGPNGKFTDP